MLPWKCKKKKLKINIFENVENTEDGVRASQKKKTKCMVRNVETIEREIDFYSR